MISHRKGAWWAGGVAALAWWVAGGGASSATEKETKPGAKYEGFVWVEGGSFHMGDVWGDSPWAMKEVPVHEVQVDDFLLAKHETTVGEFERFVKATREMVPSLRMRGDSVYPYNEKGTNWGGTSPVGSFRPNALGLYDLSGNAWEWCTDTDGTDYPAERQVNPCAQGGSGHIIRGGMYDTDAKACRASARIGWYPNAWCAGSGFRVALTFQ